MLDRGFATARTALRAKVLLKLPRKVDGKVMQSGLCATTR